jgi:hypothetical protein
VGSGRGVGLVRLGYGASLLLAPRRMADAYGAPPGRGATRLARVLGTRHVLQGLAEATGGTGHLGAAADLAHAGSALAWALLRPRWRRAALLDAAVATGFSLATGRRSAAQAGGPSK